MYFIKHLIGVILDITERKKAESEKIKLEAQLFQSQKMEALGTLAGGIAHDFNNMLAVIMGNISCILIKMDIDDDLKEALVDVQKSINQAKNLTKQLITFAKGGTPILKAIDLNPLIKETAKLVLRGSNSICKFNLAEDLWTIEADEGQLKQALSNLIINANQAMPEGGIIRIDTENEYVDKDRPFPLAAGPYVSIKVTDQGIGIPEKHLSKIFDPFFTTKKTGSGLGLATTFSIIQRHGGHIWAESVESKGTTFVIYLPSSEKPIEQSEHEEESTHLGHGKILIMDDQDFVLKMAGRMLSQMGYEYETATDGAQAIEFYRTAYESGCPFDLVILDLTVPGGIGGATAIPELQKIDPKIKAVVSSGYSNDPIMSNYKDYGFCGVVPKPYTISQLADLLNKIFIK